MLRITLPFGKAACAQFLASVWFFFNAITKDSMQQASLKREPSTTLSDFDSRPDESLARVKTVSALFDCSVPTVWRWARTGRLPAPLRVGGVTGWRVGDLRRILAGSR